MGTIKKPTPTTTTIDNTPHYHAMTINPAYHRTGPDLCVNNVTATTTDQEPIYARIQKKEPIIKRSASCHSPSSFRVNCFIYFVSLVLF